MVVISNLILPFFYLIELFSGFIFLGYLILYPVVSLLYLFLSNRLFNLLSLFTFLFVIRYWNMLTENKAIKIKKFVFEIIFQELPAYNYEKLFLAPLLRFEGSSFFGGYKSSNFHASSDRLVVTLTEFSYLGCEDLSVMHNNLLGSIEHCLNKLPKPLYINGNYCLRPVISMFCMADDVVVPITFGGIVAGKNTYKSSWHHPEIITYNNANEYVTCDHSIVSLNLPDTSLSENMIHSLTSCSFGLDRSFEGYYYRCDNADIDSVVVKKQIEGFWHEMLKDAEILLELDLSKSNYQYNQDTHACQVHDLLSSLTPYISKSAGLEQLQSLAKIYRASYFSRCAKQYPELLKSFALEQSLYPEQYELLLDLTKKYPLFTAPLAIADYLVTLGKYSKFLSQSLEKDPAGLRPLLNKLMKVLLSSWNASLQELPVQEDMHALFLKKLNNHYQGITIKDNLINIGLKIKRKSLWSSEIFQQHASVCKRLNNLLSQYQSELEQSVVFQPYSYKFVQDSNDTQLYKSYKLCKQDDVSIYPVQILMKSIHCYLDKVILSQDEKARPPRLSLLNEILNYLKQLI